MTALSDLRVLELASHVAGPFCGKLFASFGADVIKIEPPDGDEARRLGPFRDGDTSPEASGLFLYLNTNKRGITLDVHTAEGQALFRRLVPTADIVIESFPPGTLERLGLGFADLEELRPGIILTSISSFGQTGPWRDYQATDLIEYAASGLAAMNGTPDREPLKEPGYQSFCQAGAYAFGGALTALCHRDVSGLGQHVDVSALEACASTFAPRLTAYAYTGRPTARTGGGLPAGLVACKDGYVNLSVRSDESFHDLWVFLGKPEVAENPRFATALQRRRNARELEKVLQPYLATHTMEELFHDLGPMHILVGMALDAQSLVEDRHLKEREFFQTVHHPIAGDVTMPGLPFKMTGTPGLTPGPAPLLGQHNDEVFSELGLAGRDLEVLRQAGVLQGTAEGT
jgi:crotonobetainyl-CoA:carnitine CoA-transferase CaiB-like acyl-CoA transferase